MFSLMWLQMFVINNWHLWLISMCVGIFVDTFVIFYVSSLINQHWVPLFWVRSGQPAAGIRILGTTYQMSRKSFLALTEPNPKNRPKKLFLWLACAIHLKIFLGGNIRGNFYSHKDYINIVFVNIPVRIFVRIFVDILKNHKYCHQYFTKYFHSYLSTQLLETIFPTIFPQICGHTNMHTNIFTNIITKVFTIIDPY